MLLELLEAFSKRRCPLDELVPRDFVKRITNMREVRNHIAVVVAQSKERSKCGSFFRFRPTANFLDLCWLRSDAFFGDDMPEVVHLFSEQEAL